MSDTTDVTSGVSDVADDGATTAAVTKRRRGGTGLSAMLLPELQSLAASLGISGTARMRKGELITAISERQNGGAAAAAPAAESTPRSRRTNGSSSRGESASRAQTAAPADVAPPAEPVRSEPAPAAEQQPTSAPAVVQTAGAPAAEQAPATEQAEPEQGRRNRRDRQDRQDRSEREPREQGDARTEGAETGERTERDRGDRPERGDRNRQRNQQRSDNGERNDRDRNGSDRDRNDRDRNDRGPRNDGHDDDDNDGGEGGRRSRRSRFRDRRRGRDRDGGEGGSREGGREGGREPHVNEDDVLVPVAGILDVLDNYAFVRTTGYLSGPNDVYVSMSQVKKHGLRRGDAVTGAVRAAPRDGGGDQRRDKYNPLVRLDTINGMEPEEARRRPEFYKLTPLYPQERLRLESEPHILTTRVIDLVMPIGKGQRALIVSPPKAGKTMVLQAIANAITHNNPECHLMVVLVDERPEEVTDMQRSVKGEVIAATFDRPPQDHTTVAELAIERAKRLVELGHDVVVLLDSVTRLGRSYNLAAPASGRIMSGGIDSTALYPPKRFLGAARNIENGGSLTILATALVETGSMMDTVIFEEFKGTGNAELKLDRKIADKRTFPAIDIHPSGTRKEEILLGKEELAIVHKLRKVLSSLESSAALDLLLDRLKQSRTNIEFLMQIAKSTPGE
ncbi:transcription termination factor Rho [Actinoplanes sp. NPDC049681]|uniref:transcription termination factor Rho n=1 Tax=Actinoplanes sp. NPDC049681 TaxID=3363905 RepID=UPI0037A3579B